MYRMAWVDVGTAEQWIKLHALQSDEKDVVQDGLYDHGKYYNAKTLL